MCDVYCVTIIVTLAHARARMHLLSPGAVPHFFFAGMVARMWVARGGGGRVQVYLTGFPAGPRGGRWWGNSREG